jgi:hypothetical protein
MIRPSEHIAHVLVDGDWTSKFNLFHNLLYQTCIFETCRIHSRHIPDHM